MHLINDQTEQLLTEIFNLAQKRKKIYVSTRPNIHRLPEHTGPHGGKYYYEEDFLESESEGALDFSQISHKTLRALVKAANNSDSKKNKLTNILDSMYGDPSYSIQWDLLKNLHNGDIYVAGTLLNSFGDEVGNIERKFQTNKTVVHEKLKLSEDLPEGIATRINERCEEMYRKMGYKKVKLIADISIGKYAWARQGYDWNSSSRDEVIYNLRQLFDTYLYDSPKEITIGSKRYVRLENSGKKLRDSQADFYLQRVKQASAYLNSEVNRNYNDVNQEIEVAKRNGLNPNALYRELEVVTKEKERVEYQIAYFKDQYSNHMKSFPMSYSYVAISLNNPSSKKIVKREDMKKILSRKAFSDLRKNNNNLKHSWDLAKADNGKLYNVFTTDIPGEHKLGKALMLSLKNGWVGSKDLDKNSAHYAIGREYVDSKKLSKSNNQRKLFGLLDKSMYISKGLD